MFLDKIIKQKKIEVENEKSSVPLNILEKNLGHFPSRDLKKAITKENGVNIIGEIKRASPSKGIIVSSDFQPEKIAKVYEKNSISAISILTEKEFFKGEIDYISSVRKVTKIPILRKDFIIDEYQIYQSKVYGADAILLIVRILEPEILKSFMKLAKGLSIDCLVEVHDQEEAERALEAGAEIIGINNRDLDTFEIDLETTMKLAPKIKNRIIVSESGIKTKEDVSRLQGIGVQAFLIGEALMESNDIEGKIRELRGCLS